MDHHPVRLEGVHNPLFDVDQRRRCRRHQPQDDHEGSRRATVGDRHCVFLQRRVPGSDPLGEPGVALAVGRLEAPLVTLAGRNRRWIACADLGDGLSFPVAKGQLLQTRIDLNGGEVRSKRLAHQSHGFAGARQRRRHVRKLAGLTSDAA